MVSKTALEFSVNTNTEKRDPLLALIEILGQNDYCPYARLLFL